MLLNIKARTFNLWGYLYHFGFNPHYILNSFKLFGFKRELEIFSSVGGFFELYSRATEGKKDKKRIENGNFLAN